jgi:hypothetical protein
VYRLLRRIPTNNYVLHLSNSIVLSSTSAQFWPIYVGIMLFHVTLISSYISNSTIVEHIVEISYPIINAYQRTIANPSTSLVAHNEIRSVSGCPPPVDSSWRSSLKRMLRMICQEINRIWTHVYLHVRHYCRRPPLLPLRLRNWSCINI